MYHKIKKLLMFRSNHRKFIGEHSWRSVFSTNLRSIFIEITLRHRCSPIHLLHIFKTHFTSERLLLNVIHVNKCIASDRVTIESSLRPLIELETWIIGTLGYMKLTLQKRMTRQVTLRMIVLLAMVLFVNLIVSSVT